MSSEIILMAGEQTQVRCNVEEQKRELGGHLRSASTPFTFHRDHTHRPDWVRTTRPTGKRAPLAGTA